jgi:hypothetical protein
MPILTDLDYDDVRDAIDVSLDEGNLPNTTIKRDIYQGRAEDWALSRDGNADKYASGALADPVKAKRVRRAVIYYLAALLCPVVPAIKRDQEGKDEEYERVPFDAKSRAAELFAMADGELDAYLEAQPQAVQLPTIFTLACGRRGA